MMPFHMVIAAAMLPEHPRPWECLQYQLVGLIVVLVALALLWLICELAGTAFRSTKVREVHGLGGGEVYDDEGDDSAANAAILAAVHATLGPGHRVVSAVPAASDAGGKDEAAIRAAVVSAVHVALGPGHRVVSVRVCHQGSGATWSAEGRRQHFQSHKVR